MSNKWKILIVWGVFLIAGCGIHPDLYRQQNLTQIAKREYYGLGITSGEGELKTLNGHYRGQFENGIFHGQGAYVWTTRHKYEGEFVNGRMQGNGSFTWPDGSRYVGSFNNGKRDGKGTITWPDGGRFVGTFVAGTLVDKGLITYPGNKRIEGEFVQVTNSEASADVVPPAQGTIIFPDGNRFEGEIANGYPGPVGIYLDAKGRLRNGKAKCPEEEGLVACTFDNGKRVDTLHLVRIERLKMQQVLASQEKKTGRVAPTVSAAAAPESLRIREDADGLYCCPYTSDGVLAEWVDTAVKSSGWASIGGGVGMAAGAVAGKELGDELFKELPYGGLIGGIAGGLIGKKVGEEVGRDTYLDMVGGMENVRRTSDLSADSLEDLARYLYTNHADHPHFQDALKATFGIYPDLQPVYEAMAKR